MRVVQMTIDEDLIRAVDKAAKRIGTTRSGFTRHALRSALKNEQVRELERKHRQGYTRKPVKKGEFGRDPDAGFCPGISQRHHGRPSHRHGA